MNAPSSTAQSSTRQMAIGAAAELPRALDEEELAIGCECANPALQIEVWGNEAAAQPLRDFY
jgi:hypothetical protein